MFAIVWSCIIWVTQMTVVILLLRSRGMLIPYDRLPSLCPQLYRNSEERTMLVQISERWRRRSASKWTNENGVSGNSSKVSIIKSLSCWCQFSLSFSSFLVLTWWVSAANRWQQVLKVTGGNRYQRCVWSKTAAACYIDAKQLTT